MKAWFGIILSLWLSPILNAAEILEIKDHAIVTLINDPTNPELVVESGKFVYLKRKKEEIIVGTHFHSGSINDNLVKINLHALSLSSIKLNDHSQIQSEGQIDLTDVMLVINSDRVVNLTGLLGLEYIWQHKKAETFLSWVDREHATIDIKAGKMVINGIVDHLRVMASGNSELDAKSLTSRDIWLKAQDKSMVRMLPLYKFYANVFHHAKVEAYHKPPIRSVVVHDNGAMMYPLKQKRFFNFDQDKLQDASII